MLRSIVRIALLLPLLASTTGCVTVFMLQTADETEVEGYVVERVDEAWLGVNGDLRVCLSGRAPSGQQDRFVISVPAGNVAASGREATTALGGSRIVAGYAVPEGGMEDQCGPFPDGSRKILVERISSDRTVQPFSDKLGRTPTLRIGWLPEPIKPNLPGPAIYQLDQEKDGIGSIVLYQRESPEPGTARFIRLDLQAEVMWPNGALLLLLPVTLVVDAAIIYVCVGYISGGCL